MRKSNQPRIYRYVVRHDAGSAPNPFGGWCSLAICKPRIRQHALPGDWVIGLRSLENDRVIYVMQVQEVLKFPDYWRDARFESKKPDQSSVSDNIYRPNGNGALEQVPNLVHNAENAVRDLSSSNVLVSQRFWYFGKESPALSTDLVHLVHSGVGERYVGRRDDDVDLLLQWLQNWHDGVNGEPIDFVRSRTSAESETARQLGSKPILLSPKSSCSPAVKWLPRRSKC